MRCQEPKRRKPKKTYLMETARHTDVVDPLKRVALNPPRGPGTVVRCGPEGGGEFFRYAG